MKKFFVVSLSILNFTAASAQLLPARPSVVIVSTKPQLNDEDLKIINAHLCDPAEDEDDVEVEIEIGDDEPIDDSDEDNEDEPKKDR